MPLREDILAPIAGDNPSGANLRYAPVYDKIKEARREDDDLAQGDWQRERKTADSAQVIKLAGDALATQSKDLQLAAWLTEALLRKEGFGGLRQGIELAKGLVENFWDTLYPEADEDDVEMRAAPLEWMGTRLNDLLRSAPLTKSGFGFFKYKESRTVGTEADAAESEAKAESRANAIADGKITVEDFDSAFNATPTPQYEKYVSDLDISLETLGALNDLCNAKFGNSAPSFSPLLGALEEVRHTANQLLQKKLDAEGRGSAAEETPAEEAADSGWGSDWGTEGAAAAAPRRKKSSAVGLDPADADEATLRVAAVAKWMRAQDPYSPAPYLMLRGFRWGELRGYGESPDPTNLIPPSSEVRQNIKRLSLEANWPELLEAAETAMAEPCGRAWLDLQRYVVKACDESGYHAIGSAIRSELKALLTDFPALVTWTLMDDTATANAETAAWLDSFAKPAPVELAPIPEQPSYEAPRYEETEEVSSNGNPPPPDTYALAQEAVRNGRVREAIEMLATEISRAQSGRMRFQRRVELAQICMASGNESVAQPILEELASSIDAHKLEHWEASDTVAHPLVLLYRCMQKLQGDAESKQKLYSRICRLDPQAAFMGLK